MSSLNKVILIGNCGDNPQIYTFDNGDKQARVPLATSRAYTSANGEKVESTEWHKLVFSNKLSPLVEKYVTKGDKLYVEGALKTRKWTDKEGVERYSTDINVFTVKFLTSKTESNQNQPVPTPQPQSNSISEDDDDMPF